MNAKMKEACLAVADCFEFAPECWTTAQFARDYDGFGTAPSSPDACKWCAIGGVVAVLNIDRLRVIDHLQPFARMVGYNTIIDANDYGGRLVAIKMLRMAGAS